MSWRLKISVRVLVGAALAVALAAAVLALFPTVAEAQGAFSQGTSSVVVRPGDSLWSISSERLGPNATPQQIANGVERIYALNRNRIGSDPNLIFPGQKLSLPPAGEPSRAEPPIRATPAREAAEPAESSPRGHAAKSKTERASSTAVGEAAGKAGRASDRVAEPVALPDMPAKQAAPKVGSPSATDALSPVESFEKTARSLLSSAISAVVGLFPQDDLLGRRLLGLGIIALTLLVAGLMAWKLPLNRNVGGFEAWGIGKGYAGYYTLPAEATDRYEGTPVLAPASPGVEPDSGSFGGKAPAAENGLNSAGTIAAARERRERVLRERERGSGRSPRGGMATGAHNPQVARHLRRARNSAPRWTVAGRPRVRRRSFSPKRRQL